VFDEALRGYASMGAGRGVARMRRRLRKLGIRRRHWSTGKRPATGWESLTDTELATSRLVAQGMTNQQTAGQLFISTHTVAFHLRQVFRKLGITSRVELTRIAVEHARDGQDA
jgi:DNA-binding CsgD family transcriptional regulator